MVKKEKRVSQTKYDISHPCTDLILYRFKMKGKGRAWSTRVRNCNELCGVMDTEARLPAIKLHTGQQLSFRCTAGADR
jgi:DNA-directed RNA polymerase subunit L